MLQDIEKSGLDFSDIQQHRLYFHVSYIFLTKFIDYIIMCPDILKKSYLNERRKVEIIMGFFQA